MNTEGFRLSPAQRRQRSSQGEGAPARAVASRVAVRGPLDSATLEEALGDVVAKHEILRTRFEGTPEPVQVIAERGAVSVVPLDLSGESPERRERRLDELFGEAARASFDLGDSSPLRVTCARSSNELHHLILSASILCADWKGLENLVAELATAYAARTGTGRLDDETMQVADVAEWQNEILESEESAPGREHWKRVDLVSGAALAIPFENPPFAAFETATVVRKLADGSFARVEAAAGAAGVSARDFLLTAWAVLLRRLGGQSDLLVGLGVDGRQYEELREPLGLLERTLPLALVVEKETPFREVLARVRALAEEGERWQECYDGRGLENGGGPGRFLPFAFALRPALSAHAAGGLEWRVEDQRVTPDRFKCRLDCRDADGALELVLTWDRAVLGSATALRLAGQLETLLDAAIAAPEAPIDELEVLDADERRRLVVEFNDTDADYPRDWLAHDWIEAEAKRSPDKVAVRQGDRELTYRELDERANQLAHHLMERGVGPDERVTLCIERSFEMVIGIVGILKAGGAYVPIDPAYPKDRLRFLLEDTGAPVLVTQEKLVAELGATEAKVVCLDADREEIEGHPVTKPESGVRPENLVYIIYTSGSTGKPKGVVITHEKLVISNSARIAWFGHTPENFLLLSSVAFDSSVVGIFWSLCGGGTLELIPEGQEKDISRIPQVIREHGVSHLLTLPSFYRLILEQAEPEQLAGMHTVIVAGEACPLKMVEHHRRMLPGVGLFSEYGATETTVFSSVYDCLQQTLEIAPVGSPIDNAEMYVLDEHLAPCPTGVPGEVHFGGVALALGYWRRPELTAERFVSSPFGDKPGARLYKSGDLARHLESGDVEFLGRLDNQVKIRGYRIELEEIEVALLKHPALKETAVLARSDHGEEKRLVGYVLVEDGFEAPSVSELRDFLLETLPEFMAPAVVLFLDDFPRTPNGKVDRKALPEPGHERPELESDFQAAGSAAEKVLAGIWADVLGLDQVGVNDNFFELGGDSILSIQIVSRAKQAGIKLSARTLFENQTVAELASVAEVSDTALDAAAGGGPVSGPVPLTPVQHWFFELGLPRPAHWNMPLLLEVAELPAKEHLEAALRALAAHHDALRARYARTDAGWTQELAAPEAGPDPVVAIEDLSDVPEAEQVAELERRAAAHHAALDLERGPLVRLVGFDRGPGRSARLLWIVHHLVVDGVSWRILLEDLETALGQLERGEAIALPPRTTSLASWAKGLVEWAARPELAAEVEPFKALAGRAPSPLPLDHPAGENREDSARKVTVSLSEGETRSLLSEVPRTYNTQINDVLVTAMVHALANWTGEKTWLLNLEGHGREEVQGGVDLSRTVGWFTTDYPVLFTEAADFEPGEAIRTVKETLRAVPGQGFGFGVARHLSPDAETVAAMRGVPTPTVGFNYLGQFDQVLGGDARFRWTSEPFGPATDPSGPRVFVLEAYGQVSGGRLELGFEYSESLHERATIEALAKDFLATLRSLIEHCLDPTAGGFTVSDFADFAWDEEDLGSIASAIEKSQGGAASSGSESG